METLEQVKTKKPIENEFKEGFVIKRTPYLDLVITQEDIAYIKNKVSQKFCEWVFGGASSYLERNSNPVWAEIEGFLMFEEKDQSFLISKYKTLGEWMEKEHTGKVIKNFDSGKGIVHLVYAHFLSPLTDNICDDLLSSDMGEISEDIFDDWTGSELSNGEYLKDLVYNFLYGIPTEEAWMISNEKVWKIIQKKEFKRVKPKAFKKTKKKIVKNRAKVAIDFIDKYFTDIKDTFVDTSDNSWISVMDERISKIPKEDLLTINNSCLYLNWTKRSGKIFNNLIRKHSGELLEGDPAKIKLDKLLHVESAASPTSEKEIYELGRYLDYIMPIYTDFKNEIGNVSPNKVKNFLNYTKEKDIPVDETLVRILWEKVIRGNPRYLEGK